LLLCKEPRGHRGVLSAVLTEPVSPKGSFGLFYMDAKRYPYLCGHATIGAVTTLVELGALKAEDGDSGHHGGHPIRAAGGPHPDKKRLGAVGRYGHGAFFRPGYRIAKIKVADFGKMTVDLVCVGGFFAMVSAKSIGIDLTPENRSA
jgi:proline racemase